MSSAGSISQQVKSAMRKLHVPGAVRTRHLMSGEWHVLIFTKDAASAAEVLRVLQFERISEHEGFASGVTKD